MAAERKPTNEQILSLLDRIMQELEDVKGGQQRLVADLEALAKSLAR